LTFEETQELIHELQQHLKEYGHSVRYDVKIEVSGGFAHLTEPNDFVRVEIIDHDEALRNNNPGTYDKLTDEQKESVKRSYHDSHDDEPDEGQPVIEADETEIAAWYDADPDSFEFQEEEENS
jgi:hypothetical protein